MSLTVFDSDSDDYTRDGLLYASRVPWLVSPEDKQLKLFADQRDYERYQGRQQQQPDKPMEEQTDDGTRDI